MRHNTDQSVRKEGIYIFHFQRDSNELNFKGQKPTDISYTKLIALFIYCQKKVGTFQMQSYTPHKMANDTNYSTRSLWDAIEESSSVP